MIEPQFYEHGTLISGGSVLWLTKEPTFRGGLIEFEHHNAARTNMVWFKGASTWHGKSWFKGGTHNHVSELINIDPVAVLQLIGFAGSYQRCLYEYKVFRTGQTGYCCRARTYAGWVREYHYCNRNEFPDYCRYKVYMEPVKIGSFKCK